MILQAENIYKSFGNNQILKDLSFELEEGTISGIVGENGSGKSTLLKILVGQWSPNKGKVTIFDKFGYCPQQITLFQNLTVENHFKYFAAAYGLENDEMHEQKNYLMEFYNFRKYLNHKVAHLSGGTAQKLNLCLSLIHSPKLLILDEPYSGFDWDTYLKFWDYVEKIIDENCTILIVSHFITERNKFDRIYKLENGRLL
ncbi:ABC transporter ATP-binding protein [uncultured Eudoraea sp.]|uniref:ABC transporter ATP-binding protein n=1 Tax=uncultured Eudoraea sp. TaxID=1035614 RepID=UPI0026030A27|nr:ABC transporter ATP-binding protein [uncultured Eudoraea sp.]